MDGLRFDGEAGVGEEGVVLFLRFAIAASMLSLSAMGRWDRLEPGLSLEGGLIHDSMGTMPCSSRRWTAPVLSEWRSVTPKESAFQKRKVIG